MKKREFSNFDVSVIAKELNMVLSGGQIDNIYEIEDILLLKINTKEGKKNLIIKKDSRINLTNYEYPIPSYPSQYIMALRKFLRNRIILNVTQYNFDRIVIFELNDKTNESWKFIIELFNKGNYILINSEKVVKVAKRYKKFRDRSILANREYQFPKSRGLDFLTVKDEIKEIISESEAEVVRTIARKVSISGMISEEICLRANVDKAARGNELNKDQLDSIYNSLKKIRNQLLFGEINACIVKNEEDEEVQVLPFVLELFKDYEKKIFPSFNEAVDEFFSKKDSEDLVSPKDTKINKKIKAQKKILENQEEYIEELKVKKKKDYQYGDFVYANFQNLEKLMHVISEALSKGYSFEEIDSKLKEARKEGMEGAELYSKLIPSRKKLIIKFHDEEISLDLNMSIGENASEIYAKGKKADKKIQGTVVARETTLKKIQKLKKEKKALKSEIDYLVKKPKKKWYEKYRWFFTSDDYLVIGGRDASSNEKIYRKYLEPHDLVFHTDFPGSPLTIIKRKEDTPIPENSISEAAVFVASFSRAWKENWGVADVFYVDPDQVSKSPPSGEFLPRGSFMISGKKNFIKNVKTKLSIGLTFKEMEDTIGEYEQILYPQVICGPPNPIKQQSELFLELKPARGGCSKGNLAKTIKKEFIQMAKEDLKKWVELLSLDEIILYLPNGNSQIKK